MSPTDPNPDARALLKNGTPVLLEFWAPWCHPCRALEPMLARLQERLGRLVAIAKVNVDRHDDLMRQFNIRSIPTLVLAIDGREALRLPAAECPEDHIFEAVRQRLATDLAAAGGPA